MAAITYTGAAANLRASEILNAEIWNLLFDGTDLRDLCVKVGDLGGSGSAKLETPQVDFGNAMAAANADETTAAATTSITDSALSLTVAGQIISFQVSDLMQITAAAGNLSIAQLAASVTQSYVLRFTDMACVAAESFTNTVGTTTVDLVMDDIFAAVYQLEQSVVPGPYSCVLYPTQWTDLQESLRSEGGALQMHAPTADMLAIKPAGFKGSYLGVDFFASDSVSAVAAGADSNGWMMGRGGLAYAEASASAAFAGSIAAPAQSPVYAEFSREANPGLSSVTAHAYVAVGVGEDDRGVAIITDR